MSLGRSKAFDNSDLLDINTVRYKEHRRATNPLLVANKQAASPQTGNCEKAHRCTPKWTPKWTLQDWSWGTSRPSRRGCRKYFCVWYPKSFYAPSVLQSVKKNKKENTLHFYTIPVTVILAWAQSQLVQSTYGK